MTTLLERLAGLPPPGGHAPLAAVRASILEHLRRMCRTQRGSMRARPDYGLPDITEMVHSFPGAIAAIGDALHHTITTYEPRLKDVVVTHVPSSSIELVVRFEIRGALVDAPEGGELRFETRIDAARDISVV